MNSCDVLIPVRNATEVLLDSVRSLVGQEVRPFRVLLSDNHSTSGKDILEEAESVLRVGGVEVQRLRPTRELGRVEHWNWLHHQAAGEWLKPLFAGDQLRPAYFRQALAEMEKGASYIYSAYVYRTSEGEQTVVPSWAGRTLSAEEGAEVVGSYGMQFGPPSVALYRKEAFVACGGYSPNLQITADSAFFCLLTSLFGATGLKDPLVEFFIHPGRFSKRLPAMQQALRQEEFTCYSLLSYFLWTRRAFRWSRVGKLMFGHFRQRWLG